MTEIVLKTPCLSIQDAINPGIINPIYSRLIYSLKNNPIKKANNRDRITLLLP